MRSIGLGEADEGGRWSRGSGRAERRRKAKGWRKPEGEEGVKGRRKANVEVEMIKGGRCGGWEG